MTPFVISEENPYIIGRPIYEPECFFGREDLFQFIQSNLRQRAKVILLYGQRRIGKSSILTQVPNFIKLEEFTFIPLSLEGKSQKSLNNVLRELAVDIKDYLTSELGIKINKLTLPSRQESQDNRKIFADHFLPDVYETLRDQNLVLLIDEFDVLGDYSEESAANHFFPYLQSILYDQEKLFIIPVVGRRLEDMPNLSGLFRQAPKQEIGRLKSNHATRLITEPAKTSLDYAPDAIQAILELSAGHPYFTQVICSALFSYARDEGRRQVTREDVENIVNEAIELGEGGLAWFRDGLPPSERVIFSASSEIHEGMANPQFTPEEPLSLLEKYGAIRTDELNKATKNLIDWDFWQKISPLNSSTTRISTYKVTVELVRCWLIKRHPLQQEIWELENSNLEAVQVHNLADVSYEQEEYEDAIKLYEQVLELNPNYFNALLKLSEIYLTTKAFDKASTIYSRAYKVDSVRTRTGFLQASLSYSQILIQANEQENLGKVLELYVQAYQVDPVLAKENFSQTLLNYGRNLAVAKVSTTSPAKAARTNRSEILEKLQKEPTSLPELLQHCTVKINSLNRRGWGTGCVVAPNLVLTCDFVVRGIEDQINLDWGDYENFAKAQVDRLLPELRLALLRYDSPFALPCIYLDEVVVPGDSIYSFGYSDTFPSGAPVTLQCEGFTGAYHPELLLKSGQIRPGMSGAPLLNQRTGKVCGIVAFTRDRTVDLGGGGIPTTIILSAFPELKDLQQQFHQVDTRWTQLMPQASRAFALEETVVQERSRNLQILIRAVKDEVYSRLNSSLYNAVFFNLGKEAQPYEVERSWNREIKIGSKAAEAIPDNATITHLFNSPTINGKLLILGEPGSGKTTTLLDLAKDLLERAEEDLNYPVPVLFNLSSWRDEKQLIRDWIVTELKFKYGVRQDLAQQWVAERVLLPLLDGLDEVAPERQEKCIRQINAFLAGESAPFYTVVCSRIAEYDNHETFLELNGAVYLQGLSDRQIQEYLTKIERRELWQYLSQSSELLELVRTPLLLSMAVLSYPQVSIAQWQQSQTAEDRLQRLLDAYVERMLHAAFKSRVYSKQKAPTVKQTLRWLVWLARQMEKSFQTEFLIEEMQPSWLLNSKQKQIYRLTSSLIVSLFSGLSVGLLGLFFGSSFAIIGGSIGGLIGALIDFTDDDIRPVETLSFSWKNLKEFFILILVGSGLAGFFLAGLPGVSAGIVITVFLAGLRPGKKLQIRALPNQGIRKSAKNSLIVSLISFLFLGPLGILVGLVFGGRACIKHFALRLVLYYHDIIPWNYARFLDYATERQLIQRTGGRYRFLHRLLQSYFASIPL